jgi:hypothetical protein
VIQRQWNFQQGGFITSNIFIYNSVTWKIIVPMKPRLDCHCR